MVQQLGKAALPLGDCNFKSELGVQVGVDKRQGLAHGCGGKHGTAIEGRVQL
jgi:hypothetical protein